ncbi:MAG TPA: hypothetical protein VNJ08_06680 [Bacteriovoracaceae bacterium]|nr:hypothetical protein [Bacteriovoracaceae bacterium]
MKTLLAALVLMTSLMVSAQTRIVSIDAFDLSYTGGLMFKHDKGDGPDRDITNFRFNLNYAQNFEQYVGLMWKVKFYINSENIDMGPGDATDSAFGGAGGLLFNLQPEDIKNSMLFGVMGGLERATIEQSGLDDETGMNVFIELEGGKRWDLGQYSVANISYAPTVAWNWKRYGGDIRDDYFDSGYELKFNFLKFDILF